MTVLGIDPGYDRLGWAVVAQDGAKIRLLACDCIQTQKKDSLSMRLLTLYNAFSQVLTTTKVDLASVETLYFSKNVTSAIQVASARGVILLACEQYHIPLKEIAPNQVKLAVTGSGSADKKTVEKMLRLQVPHIPEKLLDDTLDAIALGVSALTTTRMLEK